MEPCGDWILSVDVAACQVAVCVDAAVTKERPMGALLVKVVEIGGSDEDFFTCAGLGDDFAARVTDETLSPELDAVAAGWCLVADSVGHGDVAAVGDGMRALNGLPGAVLAFAEGFFFRRMPADGSGKKEDFRTAQCGEAGGLGIPLVPADANADFCVSGLPGTEAKIAGSEEKFLVEERVIRDVHLAVFAEVAAIGINDGGSIVVETGGTFLKEAGNNDDAVFFCSSAHRLGAWAGNAFREFEKFVIFGLAKILGGEEFLEANDLCAFGCGISDAGLRFRKVFLNTWIAGHLDQADIDNS